VTVEHPRLSGAGTIPSWAIVAALREAERRTVRRPWLARLLGQRGPAGAGNRGGSTPGTGHQFNARSARLKQSEKETK